MTDKLLTVKDAAKWLTEKGVPISESAVRDWCRNGVVAVIQPRGAYLIPLSELERITTPQTKK
jgi:hypothetical protein